MTIMQMEFLNDLAKLLKAYNVSSITRFGDDVDIRFSDPEENPLRFRIYADGIFHEVQTVQDYKPTETELDA